MGLKAVELCLEPLARLEFHEVGRGLARHRVLCLLPLTSPPAPRRRVPAGGEAGAAVETQHAHRVCGCGTLAPGA